MHPANEYVGEDRKMIKRTELWCSACGEESSFDGNAGEWCQFCKTEEHLEPRTRLYRLVEDDERTPLQDPQPEKVDF